MFKSEEFSKLKRYLFYYSITSIVFFLISYFSYKLLTADTTYTGLAKQGYLYVAKSYAFSWTRIVLLIILMLGFGKIIHKKDCQLGRISKITVIVINVFFILFSILSRIAASSYTFGWLRSQYNIEIFVGCFALLFNIVFIILHNKNTINNLINKRRIVLEYIFSFLTIFVTYFLISHSILYVIDNKSSEDFYIFASNYMPQINVLHNIFEIILFGLIGIGLLFIHKLLQDNYKIDRYEIVYVKKRVILCVLIVLLTFIGISFGRDTIDCTSRFANLRHNLEYHNESMETHMIEYGMDLEEMIIPFDEIDEFCSSGRNACIIQWITFLVPLCMTVFYALSINKNINRMV